jgi:hypothetical protein
MRLAELVMKTSISISAVSKGFIKPTNARMKARSLVLESPVVEI